MATVTNSLMASFLPPGQTAAASQAGTAAPPSSTQTPAAAADPLANEQTFLKLLVSQLENQDPESPQDPMQFVTQLAQFTQLEQSLAMRQDLDAIKQALAQNAAPGTGTPAAPAP